MTCDECRQMLVLEEDELDVSVDARDHLSNCPGCLEFVQEQAALHAQIRKLALSERAPETLRRRVEKMVGRRATGYARSPRFRLQIVGVAATVALVLAGFLAARYYIVQRGPTADHLAQQFVSDHLHYLPGREQFVSDSPQAIQKWFEGRVDFPVHVPEIPTAAVEDARVCNIAGRKAALLHYRHKPGETLISLFVAEEPKSFEKEKY
ncbi:MAG: hypothetical protein HY508_15560, partial [Acidobacteria bacterium]|nr:hypothetical protein [Acidobacteriota bacterium]